MSLQYYRHYFPPMRAIHLHPPCIFPPVDNTRGVQMNSTHVAEVVSVVLEAHPNADALSIVRVHSAYTVVVRTQDWVGVDKGVYIVPDSVVPDSEGFSFLNGKRRIKVKRLRGIISQGLLVPAPEGSNIGDDVSELIGISHYE